MAKGDQVEVVVDMGAGMSRAFVYKATKDGRSIEVNRGPRDVIVREMAKGKQTVIRTASFLSSRCLAVVETPHDEVGNEPTSRKRRPAAIPGQLDLTHQEAPPSPAGA